MNEQEFRDETVKRINETMNELLKVYGNCTLGKIGFLGCLKSLENHIFEKLEFYQDEEE